MIDPDAANLSPDARIVSKMSESRNRDIIALLQRYATTALSQYDKAYRELIQGRRQQFKHQQEAVNYYIKSVVFAPAPGESAAAAERTPQNGFVSQNAPPAPASGIAASLGDLALRL